MLHRHPSTCVVVATTSPWPRQPFPTHPTIQTQQFGFIAFANGTMGKTVNWFVLIHPKARNGSLRSLAAQVVKSWQEIVAHLEVAQCHNLTVMALWVILPIVEKEWPRLFHSFLLWGMISQDAKRSNLMESVEIGSWACYLPFIMQLFRFLTKLVICFLWF